MTGDSGVDILEWSVRLGSDRPARRWIILAVALIAGLGGFVLFHNLVMALLAVAMVLGATADYWLGVKFRLDSEGASSRVGFSLTAMKWAQVARVVDDGATILLSPLPSATAAEAFRGVRLMASAENHDRVLEFVHQHMETKQDVNLPEGEPA